MTSRKSQKILIVGPAWVGDMVMANALFRYLKHQRPNAELHVLAPKWSLPLLARMPEVARGIATPIGHGQLKLGQRYRLAQTLKKESYQQAIILPRSFKAAIIPFLANIPQRTGWHGEWRYGVINDRRQLDKQALPLMVQRFLALGAEQGVDVTDIHAWQPRLPQSTNRVPDRFGIHADKPLVALCPGAAYGPAKRWPAAHFAAVADHLLAKDWQVVILGTANDKPLASAIQQDTQGSCIDLTGTTELSEAIDVLSMSQLVISNDSGLMHIAAALDKPLIAIYGSSSPQYTPPLSSQAQIAHLNLPCSPCFKRNCPLGHTDCLNRLKPQQVLTSIDRLFP